MRMGLLVVSALGGVLLSGIFYGLSLVALPQWLFFLLLAFCWGGLLTRMLQRQSRSLVVEAKMQTHVAELEQVKAERQECQRFVAEIGEQLTAIGEGFLTASIALPDAPEKNMMTKTFKRAQETLSQTRAGQMEVITAFITAFQFIRTTTERIKSFTDEIAVSATDLSQRTEEQASALEETSASMTEIASSSEEIVGQAKDVDVFAKRICANTLSSKAIVEEVVAAMDAIAMSSKQMSDIIGVIDNIAFQTNLLALNASVEAARAGQEGRGFAVVAGEVRNLSQKSASAANDIKKLIHDSTTKVDTGMHSAQKAGEALQALVLEISKITEFTDTVLKASQEQSDAFGQIDGALMQLNMTTQQNATLVEETNNATRVLQACVQELNQMLADNEPKAKIAHAKDALQAHIDWKYRILEMLKDPQKLAAVDLETVKAEHVCKLGKWLYEDKEALSVYPMFRTLVTAHAEFHLQTHALLLKLKQGEDLAQIQAALHDDHSPFNQATRKVIALIGELEQAMLV